MDVGVTEIGRPGAAARPGFGDNSRGESALGRRSDACWCEYDLETFRGDLFGGVTAARQLERLELDSVVSVPLVDRTFFVGDEALGADPFSARVGLVALRGNFTVASSVKLINTISVDLRDHEVVIFDFSETVYMDDSAALVVEQLIDVAIAEKTECVVMGLEGLPATTLQGLNALKGASVEVLTLSRLARTIASDSSISSSLDKPPR